MTDLDRLTVRQASDLLQAGELSAADLVEATLSRITATEPDIRAYAHVSADHARQAAYAADRAARRGPLHGIPFAVKDVLDTEVAPTEAASAVLRGHRPQRDATVVARLGAAGAILVGKHVTHEFASGQNMPPTRNPWNLDHYPGGSSVGGGASVAVGSSLFAVGTDAGGSVRKPACVTGVVGFKPTHGRVSTAGTVRGATVPSVEHIGFFARSAEDIALVLPVVAGYDPRDPRTMRFGALDVVEGLEDPLSGIRIGRPRLSAFGDPPDDEVAASFEVAVASLRGLGADLVQIELPEMRLALPAASTIITMGLAAGHAEWLRDAADRYGPETRRFVQMGLIAPGIHLHAAYRAQSAIRAHVRDVVRDAVLDAIVMPTLPCPPPRMDELVPARDMARLIQYTCPWSLVGMPAISVPCGFVPAGLPVGLQIIGPPCAEARVLQIAHAYQHVTDWHTRRPVVAAAA